MALWDRIKESASTMQTQLVAKKNDLKSGAFRDASMAMCALVAAADGTIDPSERRRVAQLIMSNEVLQNFDATDLQRRFEANLDRLVADFDFGKVSVLQEIAKAKKKENEARAVPPSATPSGRWNCGSTDASGPRSSTTSRWP
ncbi:tellurite resistance TerB family protein, partial [Streptomyces sp. NPDC001478]